MFFQFSVCSFADWPDSLLTLSSKHKMDACTPRATRISNKPKPIRLDGEYANTSSTQISAQLNG